MKILFFLLSLLSTVATPTRAQNRLSVAPTYWFNYNPYSYQVDMQLGNGSRTNFQVAGYNIVSSVGVTARYHLSAQWDLAVGALYNTNTNYMEAPLNRQSTPFTSEGLRVPVLVSYRLTHRRLSPYLSAGAVITNNLTFTDAPINTEGILGLGLDYRLNSSLSVLLQPTASYLFTQPANNASYQSTDYRSYSVGLLTQLIWRF